MRAAPLRTLLTASPSCWDLQLLCFMSTSTYVQRSEYTIPGNSGRPSVLVRLPATAPLGARRLEYIRSAAGEHGQAVAPRYWWCAAYDPQWRVHVRQAEGGKSIALSAVLGVADARRSERHRPRLSGLAHVPPGRRLLTWRRRRRPSSGAPPATCW